MPDSVDHAQSIIAQCDHSGVASGVPKISAAGAIKDLSATAVAFRRRRRRGPRPGGSAGWCPWGGSGPGELMRPARPAAVSGPPFHRRAVPLVITRNGAEAKGLRTAMHGAPGELSGAAVDDGRETDPVVGDFPQKMSRVNSAAGFDGRSLGPSNSRGRTDDRRRRRTCRDAFWTGGFHSSRRRSGGPPSAHGRTGAQHSGTHSAGAAICPSSRASVIVSPTVRVRQGRAASRRSRSTCAWRYRRKCSDCSSYCEIRRPVPHNAGHARSDGADRTTGHRVPGRPLVRIRTDTPCECSEGGEPRLPTVERVEHPAHCPRPPGHCMRQRTGSWARRFGELPSCGAANDRRTPSR